MKVLFSSASTKAWVSGVVTAVLTPLVTLFSSEDIITWRALVLALLTGIVSGAAVYAATNKPPGAITEEDLAEAEGDEIAEHTQRFVPAKQDPPTAAIDYSRPPFPYEEPDSEDR